MGSPGNRCCTLWRTAWSNSSDNTLKLIILPPRQWKQTHGTTPGSRCCRSGGGSASRQEAEPAADSANTQRTRLLPPGDRTWGHSGEELPPHRPPVMKRSPSSTPSQHEASETFFLRISFGGQASRKRKKRLSLPTSQNGTFHNTCKKRQVQRKKKRPDFADLGPVMTVQNGNSKKVCLLRLVPAQESRCAAHRKHLEFEQLPEKHEQERFARNASA